jgi:hypothetical protein
MPHVCPFVTEIKYYCFSYGENKLLFNEDGDVGFVLDQRSYFGSLQWPTETTVDMWLVPCSTKCNRNFPKSEVHSLSMILLYATTVL